MKEKLTPPDLKQCQAEVNSYHPFRCGGSLWETKRCDNKPTVIITEVRAPNGSMSLCPSCLEIAKNKLRRKFTTKPIQKRTRELTLLYACKEALEVIETAIEQHEKNHTYPDAYLKPTAKALKKAIGRTNL